MGGILALLKAVCQLVGMAYNLATKWPLHSFLVELLGGMSLQKCLSLAPATNTSLAENKVISLPLQAALPQQLTYGRIAEASSKRQMSEQDLRAGLVTNSHSHLCFCDGGAGLRLNILSLATIQFRGHHQGDPAGSLSLSATRLSSSSQASHSGTSL